MAREQAGSAQRNPGEAKTEGRKNTNPSDREQRIETGREQQRSAARRDAGTAVQRYARGASPFSLVSRIAEDMDRLFEDFAFGRPGLGLLPDIGSIGTGLGGDGRRLAQAAWAPPLETFRRGDKLVVRADLPGLKREDVKVEVENDTLTISGERRDEHEEDRDGYYRSERTYGAFYRAITLPEGVSAEQVEAEFRDGVLEVRLPAPREAQQARKRIEVK